MNIDVTAHSFQVSPLLFTTLYQYLNDKRETGKPVRSDEQKICAIGSHVQNNYI